MSHVSKRRLAENEVVFRRSNEQIVDGIAELDALAVEYGQPEHSAGPRLVGQALYFFCECSRGSCEKRVRLTLADYERIHQNRDHFVVLPGHEVPAIEHIVGHHEPEYNIVEKFASVRLPNQE